MRALDEKIPRGHPLIKEKGLIGVFFFDLISIIAM